MAHGFVVFGSCSASDLVTMFYFNEKGELKVLLFLLLSHLLLSLLIFLFQGIYPNLIAGIPSADDERVKWVSFVDKEGRVVVAEGGGRILCISLPNNVL